MKGRQSGMPAEADWSSFFDLDCIMSRLDGDLLDGPVVELGCGYGLFTEAAARRTKAAVHALDIDPEMVEATRRRVNAAGLTHVVIQQRDFVSQGCGLPDRSVSYTMLFNLLHIEQPVALLRETYRATKPGGKVAIMHWNYDSSTPRGPSLDIRPRPEQCQAWAEEAGYRTIRFEPLECCPFHYGLVGQKPGSQMPE